MKNYYDEDDIKDAKDEHINRRRHNQYSCRDRMCGALDCMLCHPENFIKEKEDEDEEY
jgi:hypothetical protein